MKLIHLSDIQETGVSHNPEIKKKVILAKGYIPNLTSFSQATFLPNQKVDTHEHPTMFEVFFIQEGKAVFTIEDKNFELKAGDCITIEPGELHSQENPFDKPVTWLYFGIATV
jgi:mannose-6-phosphate isomerase-like protein (cupin superfamily)